MVNIFSLILAVLAGGVIGGGVVWWFSPHRHVKDQLLKERDEAQHALNRYRGEVDDHFLRTAELVKQMNQSYRMVHNQLAEGARLLCSDSARRVALANTRGGLLGDEEDERDNFVKPPLDYAPSHKGTLSEEYGLHTEYDDNGPVIPPRDYADGCDDQGCTPPEKASTQHS